MTQCWLCGDDNDSPIYNIQILGEWRPVCEKCTRTIEKEISDVSEEYIEVNPDLLSDIEILGE